MYVDASICGSTENVHALLAAKQSQKVIPLVASKKTVNNITKWNQVQEELSTGIAPTPAPVPSVVVPVAIKEVRSMRCLNAAVNKSNHRGR